MTRDGMSLSFLLGAQLLADWFVVVLYCMYCRSIHRLQNLERDRDRIQSACLCSCQVAVF